jgi:hypothetical protein
MDRPFGPWIKPFKSAGTCARVAAPRRCAGSAIKAWALSQMRLVDDLGVLAGVCDPLVQRPHRDTPGWPAPCRRHPSSTACPREDRCCKGAVWSRHQRCSALGPTRSTERSWRSDRSMLSVMLSVSAFQRERHDHFARARSRGEPAPRCCPEEGAGAHDTEDARGEDLGDLIQALGRGHQVGVEGRCRATRRILVARQDAPP